MSRLKKLLGFCECKGCLRRGKYEMTIKAIEVKKNICNRHLSKITQNAELIKLSEEE